MISGGLLIYIKGETLMKIAIIRLMPLVFALVALAIAGGSEMSWVF